MDFHTLLSHGIETNLQCFVCGNYLSNFPISLCSNNKSICARCTIPDGLISFQNETFEAIAKFLKFPCRFECDGCPEELLPEKIPQHEKLCPFRKVKCILNNTEKCGWEGALPTLEEHCRDEHDDLFLKNGEFELDLSVDQKFISLVQQNNKLLIFSRNYDSDSKILNCALYNHEYDLKSENCDFQLKLKHNRTSLVTEFQISCFEEILFEEFSLKFFDNKNYYDVPLKGKLTSFDQLDEYEKNGINPKLCPKFLALHVKLLTCSKCENLSTPPISNLSLCNNCVNEHTMHSTSPNEFLNELANYIDYPCKNSDKGCLFTSKYQKITEHEANCIYNQIECLIYGLNLTVGGKSIDKCIWKGNKKDLREHMLDHHETIIIRETTTFVDLILLSAQTKFYRILECYGSLFMIQYWCLNERCYWTIHKNQCCNQKEKDNFIFEINFIDLAKKGNRLIIREFLKNDQDKFSFNLAKALLSSFEDRTDKTDGAKKESFDSHKVRFTMRFLKT